MPIFHITNKTLLLSVRLPEKTSYDKDSRKYYEILLFLSSRCSWIYRMEMPISLRASADHFHVNVPPSRGTQASCTSPVAAQCHLLPAPV